MKTILMLIVALMLAGCGSTGNHVRNRDAVDRNRYLVEHNAVDTRYALALDDYTMALPQPTGPLCRIALESFLIAGWQIIQPLDSAS